MNLNFPLGLPETEITKAAESGHETPVPGSVYHGLSPAQFSVCNFISDSVRKAYELKVSFENPDALKEVERYTILSAIDRLWQEHLYEMDSLRYSIGLRGYGQRDPLIEYKAEAFSLFETLMVNIKTEICHNIFRSASSLMAFENFLRNVPQRTTHQSTSAFGGATAGADASAVGNGPPKPATSSAKPPRPSKKPARSAPVRRLAVMILAPARAAKNTSTAAEKPEREKRKAGKRKQRKGKVESNDGRCVFWLSAYLGFLRYLCSKQYVRSPNSARPFPLSRFPAFRFSYVPCA